MLIEFRPKQLQWESVKKAANVNNNSSYKSKAKQDINGRKRFDLYYPNIDIGSKFIDDDRDSRIDRRQKTLNGDVSDIKIASSYCARIRACTFCGCHQKPPVAALRTKVSNRFQLPSSRRRHKRVCNSTLVTYRRMQRNPLGAFDALMKRTSRLDLTNVAYYARIDAHS